RIRYMEGASALAPELPRMRAQMDAGALWTVYGADSWLVTITAPAPPVPALLIALSPDKAAPPGVTLAARTSAGEPLGESFPALRAQLPASRSSDSDHRSPSIPLFVAGLGLVA